VCSFGCRIPGEHQNEDERFKNKGKSLSEISQTTRIDLTFSLSQSHPPALVRQTVRQSETRIQHEKDAKKDSKFVSFTEIYDVSYDHQPNLDPPSRPSIVFVTINDLRRVVVRCSKDFFNETLSFARMEEPTWSTGRWMFSLRYEWWTLLI